MIKVDNAVILAAGASSRFAPLSYERHKALIEVKGEVLIERQIRQLREAGVKDIYVVTGYKSEQFSYLVEKFGVKLASMRLATTTRVFTWLEMCSAILIYVLQITILQKILLMLMRRVRFTAESTLKDIPRSGAWRLMMRDI